MKNILIVKTSALGDIIHAYPVIHYLKKKFPAAKIDWVVEAPFADLVHTHPGVNRVFTVATKKWRRSLLQRTAWQELCAFRHQLRAQTYDAVFDLQGNIKSGLIVSQAKSPFKVGFGKDAVPEWPNLLFTNTRFEAFTGGNIRQDYLNLVSSFFGDSSPEIDGEAKLKISDEKRLFLENFCQQSMLQNKLKVMVCPGSAWRNKQLTPETLAAFLTLVQEHLDCVFLLVWGTPEERESASQLQKQLSSACLVDKMPLSMLQNLMDMSDLIIAMDSLPLHLAGTTKTPSFSVFGASLAIKYKPIGIRHEAFQGHCPYGKTFEKRCPILRTCSTGACIRSVEAAQLFESFSKWWSFLKIS
jgi:heptosyltransferase I